MASGPPPKPAELRQRTNRKAGADVLTAPSAEAPALPNHPDGRVWHPYTLTSWVRAWTSAMASKWLPSEFDGVFRLAMKWDDYYLKGKATDLAEIRLQEQRFGLSPLDRSRLQWEVEKGSAAEERHSKRQQAKENPVVGDPRQLLRAVPK